MSSTDIDQGRIRAYDDRVGSSGAHFQWVKKVTAAEPPLDAGALLNDMRHGVRDGITCPEVEWSVVKPAGVSAYDVVIYRWVSIRRKNGREAIPGKWVAEDTFSGLTDDLFQLQYTNGLIVALAITAATGTIGDGFEVGVRRLSKRS